MLRLMRDYAGSWIIKFILGAIVIVFVFWGVGSYSSRKASRLAQVNGETITVNEYREAYNNRVEQLRQRFGKNLNDEMIEMLQVKRQALDGLIDQLLLLQESKKLKFQVSDIELVDAIRNIGAFQRAGVFNNRLYANVLNRYRMTPEKFEIVQRKSMLMEKLKSFITSSIKVSDLEALEWFKWKNTSVNINFALFEPGKYEDVKPSREEIRVFFDENKSSYKTEAMVKVRFLQFKPDEYASKVKVFDEDMLDYYETNSNEFKTPKTVEARHILIKVSPDASSELADKKRAKALEIFKMAGGSKDFAELAKQYSEGPSKDSGGYLGTFKRESMVKPFADKAFSMKAGEISEPVRTQFGWHIIKIETVNETSFLSFKEAESKIRKKLTDEMTKNLAYDEAESVYDASFEGDDLAKIAEARNLDIRSPELFTIKGPKKGIKNRTQFASTAFNLSVMETSDIQDMGDEYYIIQLLEKIPEKIPEFEDVTEMVMIDLIEKKQDNKALENANALLSALKNGMSMDEESGKYGLTPIATGFFKRKDSIPKVGFEQEILQAAFKLTHENRFSENVHKGKNGYYVIGLIERKEPGAEGFDKEKEEIKDALKEQKTAESFNAWLLNIRDRSDISVEQDFFN